MTLSVVSRMEKSKLREMHDSDNDVSQMENNSPSYYSLVHELSPRMDLFEWQLILRPTNEPTKTTAFIEANLINWLHTKLLH